MPPENSVPTVELGQYVHYVIPEGMRYAGECRAAKVNKIWREIGHPEATGMIDLIVTKKNADDFDDAPVSAGVLVDKPGEKGQAFLSCVHFSDVETPGKWTWHPQLTPDHLPGESPKPEA